MPDATIGGLGAVTPIGTMKVPIENDAGTANGYVTLQSIGSVIAIASGALAARPSPGVVGHLYYVTDAATPHLTFDNGTTWQECPINGTYTPVTGGAAPIAVRTLGSTVTAASTAGIRRALISLLSTDPADEDSAVIDIQMIQRSHAVGLARTGIAVTAYTEPDIGGDVSGGLFIQTGGGNAISAYKSRLLRPAGFTDYSSAAGGAAEFGTADGQFAINVVSGGQIGGGSTMRSTGIRVRIDNAVSDGIMVEPGGAGTFDTRYAFLTGNLQTDAAPVNVKCFVYLNGDAQFARLAAGAVGGAVSPGVSVGGQATTFAASGYSSLDGIRFRGTDADNSIFQNNANALAITTNTQPLYLGAGISAKHLRISTAGNIGIGTETFGTNAAGVLSIASGTAPTTGPADTVQFYSSDNSAGHTIPSFFCEGTEVLATGQADSVSSVRVKVRVNGVVVTLLGI